MTYAYGLEPWKGGLAKTHVAEKPSIHIVDRRVVLTIPNFNYTLTFSQEESDALLKTLKKELSVTLRTIIDCNMDVVISSLETHIVSESVTALIGIIRSFPEKTWPKLSVKKATRKIEETLKELNFSYSGFIPVTDKSHLFFLDYRGNQLIIFTEVPIESDGLIWVKPRSKEYKTPDNDLLITSKIDGRTCRLVYDMEDYLTIDNHNFYRVTNRFFKGVVEQ